VSSRGEETISRLLAGLRDSDSVRPLLHPDVVYVNPPEAIEPGIRRGPDEVVAAMRAITSAVDIESAEFTRAADSGDRSAVALTLKGEGQASGATFEASFGLLLTFDGDQLIRYQWWPDPVQPFAELDAAGQ
jgi:ketosteroid isomerase-like protein